MSARRWSHWWSFLSMAMMISAMAAYSTLQAGSPFQRQGPCNPDDTSWCNNSCSGYGHAYCNLCNDQSGCATCCDCVDD